MGFRRWIVCGGALGKQKRICLTVLYVVHFYFNFLFYGISLFKLGSKVTLSRKKEQIWAEYYFLNVKSLTCLVQKRECLLEKFTQLVNLTWIAAVPAKNHILCDFI